MADEMYVTPDSRTAAAPDAYARGRRVGLAIGALATAVAAFISLLGLEKAILAAVLAWAALRGTSKASPARRLAAAALIVSIVYAVTWIVLLAVFHEKLHELLQLLQKLG
ncbi:MAG: hypothetical protein HRF43_04545 [Phycisphaerae bacterium]|jgi:hypothetical protein